MPRFLLSVVISLTALAVAAVHAAIFYVFVDLVMEYDVEWPVVLAVGFVIQAAATADMRLDAKQDGRL